MTKDWLKGQFNLANLILIFASIQFVWLVWYFYTGLGGPLELVLRLLSKQLKLKQNNLLKLRVVYLARLFHLKFLNRSIIL